jgi:hypothetical protein
MSETTMTTASSKNATLSAKVAGMSWEEIEARMLEIADSKEFGPDEQLEFAKLLLGPEATVSA